MPCYHPIIAYQNLNEKTKKGKSVIKFSVKAGDRPKYTRIELPCGQCLGCEIEKSNQWATRICLEAKMYKHNYFVTLTYNEDTVPVKINEVAEIDQETEEILGFKEVSELSLKKSDHVAFMKALRQKFAKLGHQGIRFFMCGEYGEETHRPHYHYILLNCPLYDLVPFFVNSNHQQIYRSKMLEETWQKGNVSIGEVTFESRAYVRRYTLKKQHWKEKPLIAEPEFILMSRNPGIGKPYYERNKDKIYKNDEVLIKKELSKALMKKPPKYFDEILDVENPILLEQKKMQRRKNRIATRNNRLERTSLSADEYLIQQERIHREKIARLKTGMQKLE